MLSLALVLCWMSQGPTAPAAPAERDLAALLRADPRLADWIEHARERRVQVLVSEPVVAADGRVTLVRSAFGDTTQYFYPASAIKLGGAIAALVTLNEHNRAHGAALGLGSPFSIEPRFAGDVRIAGDKSNVLDGTLTVAHDLRKMLLVSDNQAFNHCYEIAGQRELNAILWRGGCTSARVWHRLSESHTVAENRQTREVRFGQGDAVVTFAARDAGAELKNDLWHDFDVGDAFVDGDRRVAGPMSFTQKNAILLRDLQDLLVGLVRPDIVTGKRGFPELSVAQREFLVHVLGEPPRESPNPRFDAAKVPDESLKFMQPGIARVVPLPHLRLYDKTGRAYGFSIENGYVEDQRTGRGFFLAIVCYTNPDGVLNDDQYGYEELADPFLQAVGEVVTRAVMRS